MRGEGRAGPGAPSLRPAPQGCTLDLEQRARESSSQVASSLSAAEQALHRVHSEAAEAAHSKKVVALTTERDALSRLTREAREALAAKQVTTERCVWLARLHGLRSSAQEQRSGQAGRAMRE